MPILALIHEHVPDLTMTYMDAKGHVEHRTITAQGVLLGKDGTPALRAFCHLRGAMRTFLCDRILHLSSADGARSPWDNDALQTARERLAQAERFQRTTHTYQSRWPGDQAWEPWLGGKAGLAWRDPEGSVRMDPAPNWGFHEAGLSAHARMAGRLELLHRGTRVMDACPPEAVMALVLPPYAGWQDTAGRWRPMEVPA